MELPTGIEPASDAWKAPVLPLDDSGRKGALGVRAPVCLMFLVLVAATVGDVVSGLAIDVLAVVNCHWFPPPKACPITIR